MEEGNPMLALERGEGVEILSAIWFQGQPDPVHDYRDPKSPLDVNEPERFVGNYRKAGGAIEIAHVEQSNRSDPSLLGPLGEFLPHEPRLTISLSRVLFPRFPGATRVLRGLPCQRLLRLGS